MKIMVVGPESSGTRMVTALLNRSPEPGLHVFHSSPAFREWVTAEDGTRYKYWAEADVAVLVVRNGSWNARSMVNRERLKDDRAPREQISDDLLEVLTDCKRVGMPVHIVTYEALVYEEPISVAVLCQDLGIKAPLDYDDIQNGNAKFWDSDGWEGDDRWLDERGVVT